MKILLTGATGFIGGHLLAELRREDHEIWAVSRDPKPNFADDIRIVEHDLTKPLEMAKLPGQIDSVIHLAQSEHFRDFPQKASEIFYTNTLSTQQLLDYARRAGAKQFVFASSGGIYGHNERAFSEDDSIGFRNELGFYLGTKLCSEVLAQSYETIFDVITLRLFFVYGPGQKRAMLMPRLIKSIRDGLPINLNGSDGIKINPIYVTDAVAAIKSALKLNTSSKINVGGAQPVFLRELCEMIGEITGREPVFQVDESSSPPHLVGDIGKMIRLLVAPNVTFAEGLRTTVQYALDDKQ